MKLLRATIFILLWSIPVFVLIFNTTSAQLREEIRVNGSIAQFELQGKPLSFAQRSLPTKPVRTQLTSFDDRSVIGVKFIDNIDVTLDGSGQPADKERRFLTSDNATTLFRNINTADGVWQRISAGYEEQIEQFRVNAEQNLNRAIAKLNNYFLLRVPTGINTEEWIDQLNALPEVEIAEPRHLPPPLPTPGNFQGYQGYLNATPNGIDASYAWSLNDSGQNVTICDFEYAWNLNHQDLPGGIGKLIPPGYTEAVMTAADTNHGTAVLGVLASKNNGWGTKGAAYGATLKVAPTNFTAGWWPDVALLYAMTQLSRGDVFLIEQQEIGPFCNYIDTGLVPLEWNGTIYNIILTAVGNGFHVVEAGANGYRNLDSSIYNQNHAPFLPQNNSGAIIVGAGAAPPPRFGSDTARSRLSFSNYGSRLNLQGWGEKVTTTGTFPFCSALYTAEGKNYYYDSCFCGTSSASPVVAAAVALVQSRFKTLYGTNIAPITMRTMLKNTGTAQKSGWFPSSQNIGPLPNVRAAIDSFASPTMTLAGTYTVGLGWNYTNLTSVAADLKQKVVTGNVIFEIQSSYQSMTETLTIIFNEFTTRGGDWTVTIRPASGITSVLTYGKPPAHPWTPYPVIKLDGIDRMTLDGRPGGSGTTGVWTIRNTRQDSVGATIQLDNDATNNVIKYLTVEGQNTGTYSVGTIYFGGYTGLQGNSHNIITNCDIRDRSDLSGIPVYAIYGDWVIGADNDSNTIQDNNIYNWSMYGMYLDGNRWKINGNSLYEQYPMVGTLTGMYIVNGNGHIISDNHIGGSAPQAGATSLNSTGATLFTGMWLGVDTLQATSIQGNRITNITCSNSVGSGFMGISFFMGDYNIGTTKRNIIGDSNQVGNITIAGNGAVGGIIMNGGSRSIINIENNLIANIDQTHPMPGEMRAINIFGMKRSRVVNNEIRDIGPTMPMAGNSVRGIYLSGVNDTVTVANNMITLSDRVPTDCQYRGIYNFSPTSNRVNVFHNSVYVGGTSGGINNTYCYLDTGFSFVNIKNNIFHSGRSGVAGFHYAMGFPVKPFLNFDTSDYNIFYNVNNANLFRGPGIDMNLQQWQTMIGGDINSVNLDPKFNNPGMGDLHMNPAIYSPADNSGISIAAITSDFDNQARGSNPDRGADEYTINIPPAFSLQSPGNGSADQPKSGQLIWHPSASAGRYDVLLDTLTPPTITVSSNQSDTTYSYSALDTNKHYYWKVIAKNSSGSTSSAGSPWSFLTGASTGEVTGTYSMLDGWNMVSVPLIVQDYSKDTLYPTASSDAFTYTTSYVTVDTLENGIGYWVKFSGNQDVSITGYASDSDSIIVKAGWNMVGSISVPVPVDSIVSYPGGMIVSSFYGYNGSYYSTDTIQPGYAYWVKVDTIGYLYIGNSSGTLATSRIRISSTIETPPPPPDEKSAYSQTPVPSMLVLEQNYPNPFNPVTVIRYQLPTECFVNLKIYNVLGVEVAALANTKLQAGYYAQQWNASGIPSGIYFYRLQAGNSVETKRLLLLR